MARAASPLELAVEQQLGPAAARGPAAAHPRHRPQVLDVRGPRRHQLHRPHDPVPVPPRLRQLRVLAPVDDHDELVRSPRPQAARLDRERRVGIDVAPDPAPVQEHGGVAADALEAQHPAEPARRGRSAEAQPVAPHLARIAATAARACRTRSARSSPATRPAPGRPLRPPWPGAPARRPRARSPRGRRLRLRRGGHRHAHLPPARQRQLARRRGERRRGERGRGEGDAGCHEYAGRRITATTVARCEDRV